MIIYGISLVLVHSKKGLEMFEQIKEKCIYKKCEVEKCLQHNLKEPTRKPEKQEQFWKDYEKRGYSYIAKKYGVVGVKSVLKNKFQILMIKFGVRN